MTMSILTARIQKTKFSFIHDVLSSYIDEVKLNVNDLWQFVTLVLGSINSAATPGRREWARACYKENPDEKSAGLAACRLTKRGDELIEVVLSKIIQWFKSKSPCTTKEVLLRIFADLWIHRENGVRAITKRKSWEGVFIKILQNSTVVGRSLSGEIGNNFTVPKGDCGLSPKDGKHVAQKQGEVYSLPNWTQNVNDSIACCSVVERLRTGRNLVNGFTYRCVHV